MRVCSGKFERNKYFHHVRLDKDMRFSNPYSFMARSKDIIEDADEAKESNYFQCAEKAMTDKNYFDAVVLYALSMQLDGFNRWAIDNYQAGNHRSYHRMTEPRNLVTRLVTNLSKRLYKEHKPFDEEEVNFTYVRPSQWGIRVMVDGVEIKY